MNVSLRFRVLTILQDAKINQIDHRPVFIMIVLRKKVGFANVITMIDKLVVSSNETQLDDNHEQE